MRVDKHITWIGNIDDVKAEFPDNFKEWVRGFVIDEEDLWDIEVSCFPNGNDEKIYTYKQLWDKGKKNKKYLNWLLEDIDDNMFEQLLDYVIEQLNKNGLLLWNWCISDSESGYDLWIDEVELDTEEELVMMIAGLINKGVQIDIDNVMTKVLVHVI